MGCPSYNLLLIPPLCLFLVLCALLDSTIVVAGKAMVPPVDLVYLEKIIKNISNRNFSSKLISVDAECFKLSVDMYFDPKRSLVACTGRINCNICVKNRRENHH